MNINTVVEFTPTQVQIINALKEGPKTTVDLLDTLGKDLFNASASLIKTQVCLINKPYKAAYGNNLIASFIDQDDSLRKYRLLNDSPEYKLGEELTEMHQLLELVVENTENSVKNTDNIQLITKGMKDMNTKMFIAILLTGMIVSFLVGGFLVATYFTWTYEIVI